MKIRIDFITNSSSTSFIIITSEDLKKEDFYDLVGIPVDSPLSPIFSLLFDALRYNMEPYIEYFNKYRKGYNDLEAFLTDSFSTEVAKRVDKAQKEGKLIFIGDLSSDYNEIESFFCCDSFELENDKIYLNALSCTW